MISIPRSTSQRLRLRLLPPEEAAALQAEFDPHFERLLAIWADMQPEPDDLASPPARTSRKARQPSP